MQKLKWDKNQNWKTCSFSRKKEFPFNNSEWSSFLLRIAAANVSWKQSLDKIVLNSKACLSLFTDHLLQCRFIYGTNRSAIGLWNICTTNFLHYKVLCIKLILHWEWVVMYKIQSVFKKDFCGQRIWILQSIFRILYHSNSQSSSAVNRIKFSIAMYSSSRRIPYSIAM